MTSLTFAPLHAEFGARVTGLDLTRPLTREELTELRDAIDRYCVLCLSNLDMTDDKHLAFTRQLGEPEVEHVKLGKTGEADFFGTVGNISPVGTKKGNAHANTHYQTGNQLWHSDSSFRETPSFVSILHGYEVPDEGGQTLFASMRTAYARLPEEMKNEIENLNVVHDYVFSRSQVAPVDPNHAASLPPVTHKLVKTNSGTGEKNYYVGSHARSIPGLSGMESRHLLDDLLARAVEADHVYAHNWQVGDTVIWDNRCILHRGGGYDADRWRRYLRQTRVIGDTKGVIPS